MESLMSFLCVHASVVILRCSLHAEDFMEPYFHVDNYQNTYEKLIHRISSMSISDLNSIPDAPKILAPSSKRQPSRSHKRRMRSQVEVVRRIKFERCGEIGNHNRKTCNEPVS